MTPDALPQPDAALSAPLPPFDAEGRPQAAPLCGHDWTVSALGDPAQWARPLRAAAAMLFDSPVPMWLAWGEDLSMVYNDAYAALLGSKHPSALGAPLAAVWSEIWPDLAPLIAQTLSGRGVCREDLRLRVERGREPEDAWFTFSFTPLRDDASRVAGLSCTVWETTGKVRAQQDISARADEARRQQARQEEVEERYRLARLATNDAIWDWRLDDGHVIWNQAVETLFGYRLEQTSADWWLEHIHPSDRRRIDEAIHGVIDGGGSAWSAEYRFRRVDGSYADIFDRGTVLRDADGRALRMIGAMLDLSERNATVAALREVNETLERRVIEGVAERVRIEDALRQAQKMEAVGQLTGGIAHDFNNMLAVVNSALELLGRRFSKSADAADERALHYIGMAKGGVRRAADLTQRLLAFSRQQALTPGALCANRLVDCMSELLVHSLGADVRLDTALADGLWTTWADANQLENAILNLAVNARDAMPEGGVLRIETANVRFESAAAASSLAPGDYVMVAVGDSGAGMPPEVAARAFEPFFTTKEVGRGTGLGLSQVYGFARQSGGDARIDSVAGQGATVRIYLPRHVAAEQGTPEAAGAALQAPAPRRAGGATILVVEDEEAVRILSVDMLRELGYQVIAAEGASAALRALDAHPDIALLFTDVIMPETNGRKLADAALARNPGLRVLFATGFSRNALVQGEVLEPGVELISKPFTMAELATRVRKVLDAP